MFAWFKRLTLLASVGLLAACGGGDDHPPTVVDIARSDARFSILSEAVIAADLGTTLSAPGTLTVFAPTNDAFAALLTELGISKAQLLADKALLTSVLTYHVLPAKVERAAIPAGKPITTLQGGIFKIEVSGDTARVTDGRNRVSTITATDIQASNGVVHVLDRVLLPADKTIVQTASALPDFSILVEAVVAADLAGTLSGNGPFTVFAPTNAAFAALLTELGLSKDALLADKALLSKVLTYHVLPARVLKADVPVGPAITTVQGNTFTIDANLDISDRNGRKARITATDVLASNGVIHVIDKVILPTL
ncbi:fasciclin domain-containing protein [Paucibacter sp. XJ19-41]|uniref:fasciclin domain-containing protein n=1 Tax=Paucibacter sp. XJ19-41 TaxID=2927824 RepID=UPI002349ADEF|nr:fasciclin domain-containing protein [Paucibacter sp. XJ19-41]MDC6168327.1 fasciclin domain-containing protein [Paucibacter sp. XJ19-41]